MSRMIVIRNVPDELHRTLKARATKAGVSLSAYVPSELIDLAERPTLLEMRETLRFREPVSAPIDTAQFVRDERDTR